MTVVADREPEAARKDRRVWLVLGAVFVLGLTVLAVTRPSEFCPSDLRNVVDDDNLPTSGVVCEGPIIREWQLTDLVVAGSVVDVPPFENLGSGWIEFRADGSLGGRFCNSFATHFQVSEDALRTSEVVSTLVGCDGAEGSVEQAVLSAFRYANADYTITYEEIDLPGPSGDVTFSYQVLIVMSGDTTMIFHSWDY